MRKSILSLSIIAALFIVTNAKSQEFPELDSSPMDVAYFPNELPHED
jgi:hypothetical protein